MDSENPDRGGEKLNGKLKRALAMALVAVLVLAMLASIVTPLIG